MEYIRKALRLTVWKIVSSDQNYEQSFDFYRFWFDIGRTHYQIPSDDPFDSIWASRETTLIDSARGKLIHPTAHLILRFACDAESDSVLAPHNSGLQSRLCASSLSDFFGTNMKVVQSKGTNVWTDATPQCFYADTNLIAHWSNIGFVEEAVIRNHILQSLISHPKLYDHQADALIILFKLAGATFEAYAGPSVVDRCFELLKDHYGHNSVEKKLVQVRARRPVKHGHRAETFSGGGFVTGAWVGGPPSPTHIYNREAKTDRREPGRHRCNPSCHVPGTSQQRSRTADPSAHFTRINHRPRSRHGSWISGHIRHPVSV